MPDHMMAVLAATMACSLWHSQVVGLYPGVVESTGEKPIDTWIEETPEGRLQGHYVLHEPDRDVSGVLEGLGDAGCEAGLFRWTDIYGTGLARLQFYPERHCFEGAWGHETINPALVWHACVRQRVTS